jgi:hypothetical protein
METNKGAEPSLDDMDSTFLKLRKAPFHEAHLDFLLCLLKENRSECIEQLERSGWTYESLRVEVMKRRAEKNSAEDEK